jgi:integrase
VAALPDRYRLLVLTDIETGLRWGELIALRPRHIDFLRRMVSVEQTIVEVSRKQLPEGRRVPHAAG